MRNREQARGLRGFQQTQALRPEIHRVVVHGGARRRLGEIQVEQHDGAVACIAARDAVPIQQR
jgi:hypothetical protein